MSTHITVLSVVVAILSVSGQILIRKRRWEGFVVSLVNQIPFTWIAIETQTYGYLILSALYLWNAICGIREWRPTLKT